jgi:putative NADPH-quinone reductase
MQGDKKISFDTKSEMDKVNKADLLIFHFHMKHNTVPGIFRDWLDHLLFSGKMFCFSTSVCGEGLKHIYSKIYYLFRVSQLGQEMRTNRSF